jgi:hypothetical protein
MDSHSEAATATNYLSTTFYPLYEMVLNDHLQDLSNEQPNDQMVRISQILMTVKCTVSNSRSGLEKHVLVYFSAADCRELNSY